MTKGTKDIVKRESEGYVSPFEEFERWFDEAWKSPFSLFRSSPWHGLRAAEREVLSPSVDIYDEGKELVLKADVPGIGKDDLDINLTENVLTISGRKEKEEKVERENYFRFERSHGSFCRRFELPGGVDTEKIKAHYEDGVLEVRLPKTGEAKKKQKKISVD